MSYKIRKDLGVENVTSKARQARLRLYGHSLRMDKRNYKMFKANEEDGSKIHPVREKNEDTQHSRRWSGIVQNRDLTSKLDEGDRLVDQAS